MQTVYLSKTTGVPVARLKLKVKHRLMCGDSTSIDAVERLMDGRQANMLHTDPPYGVDYEGVPNDHLKDVHLESFLHDALTCAFAALEPGSNIYVWHADITALEFISAFRSAGFTQARPSTIQWVKSSLVMSQGDYHSQNEPCLYGWKDGKGRVRVKDRKQTTIWNMDRTNDANVHPTMKPVALCQRAIENSSVANHIVLDLFGGSGSTLVACEKDRPRLPDDGTRSQILRRNHSALAELHRPDRHH